MARSIVVSVGLALAVVLWPSAAEAGRWSWFDDFIQHVAEQARRTASEAGRAADEAAAGAARSGDEAAGAAVRSADDVGVSAGRSVDELASARRSAGVAGEASLDEGEALARRLDELVGPNGRRWSRELAELPTAERRELVALAETAQRLATRYPAEAGTMLRNLGPEGLRCVRLYGDDVALAAVREGPAVVRVARRTGRAGLNFLRDHVWPHRRKLLTAGVLTLFLTNPEMFIDPAGRITRYAAEQFSRAGVDLAASAGEAVVGGLRDGAAEALAGWGVSHPAAVWIATGLVVLLGVSVLMWIFGKPLGLMLAPVRWVGGGVRRLVGRRSAAQG